MTRKVALATCAEFPALIPGDRLLLDALLQRNIRAQPVIWTDDTVNWDTFDVVVLRSVWDYHLGIDAFRAWINDLSRRGIRLYNPAPVVNWNMDKIYLRDLEAQGVNVVPTRWIAQEEQVSLAALFASTGWEKAVVKPRISASAYQTWVTTPDTCDQDQARLDAMSRQMPVMVQPFIAQIAEGEWSFVFIGGHYSHAVLKRPDEGSIFTQQELGAANTLRNPQADLIQQAADIFQIAQQKFDLPILYTRVDALDIEGRLQLMELELIEPELFLELSPPSVERLADCIAEQLSL